NVESSTLRVIATGDGFWITGLVPGETLSLYNMQGQLIHQNKANATEQRISLRVRGVYIAVSGERRVKAAY
ncbi:MAG: T9SS type A sorting domain-containing protein, partial [Tannerellaceae bacterium]|nr:T9SS type A sorting domain-containing protein [Tannerellaceae bacterium]